MKKISNRKYFETIGMIDYWGWVIGTTQKQLSEMKPRTPLEAMIDKACGFIPEQVYPKEIGKKVLFALKERAKLKKSIEVDCKKELEMIKELEKFLSA